MADSPHMRPDWFAEVEDAISLLEYRGDEPFIRGQVISRLREARDALLGQLDGIDDPPHSEHRPELWSSVADGIGRDGIVTVWGSGGGYLGCMGQETWQRILGEQLVAASSSSASRPESSPSSQSPHEKLDKWEAFYPSSESVAVTLGKQALVSRARERGVHGEGASPSSQSPHEKLDKWEAFYPSSEPSEVLALPVCPECREGRHVFCLDDGSSTWTDECRCTCREEPSPARVPEGES